MSRPDDVNLDFQRLARVRARQRSRRKSRLTVLTTLVMAVVIVAVSRLAAPMIPPSQGGSLVGEAQREARGWVQTVERRTSIIRVSSGFLGLRSLELVVTPETLIVVGDKEGGLGDIREGERIQAVYEVRPGGLRANRVEVFVHESPIASPASMRSPPRESRTLGN